MSEFLGELVQIPLQGHQRRFVAHDLFGARGQQHAHGLGRPMVRTQRGIERAIQLEQAHGDRGAEIELAECIGCRVVRLAVERGQYADDPTLLVDERRGLVCVDDVL